MANETHEHTTKRKFDLGYEITGFGKLARILLGGWLVYSAVRYMVGPATGETNVYIALNFAGIFLVYLAAHLWLGERVLARMSPWVGTMLLVAAPTVISMVAIPGIPVPFRFGLALYIGTGLLVNVFTNYGGCEVLAFQSLMFGRWYKVYCPINVLDAAENVVVGSAARAKAPPRRMSSGG